MCARASSRVRAIAPAHPRLRGNVHACVGVGVCVCRPGWSGGASTDFRWPLDGREETASTVEHSAVLSC
eukprot:15450235-Alexandrium_andersonii.AAC.1